MADTFFEGAMRVIFVKEACSRKGLSKTEKKKQIKVIRDCIFTKEQKEEFAEEYIKPYLLEIKEAVFTKGYPKTRISSLDKQIGKLYDQLGSNPTGKMKGKILDAIGRLKDKKKKLLDSIGKISKRRIAVAGAAGAGIAAVAYKKFKKKKKKKKKEK